MDYKIIVAFGMNNEIGAQGKLLWHLPKDMRWFKENTTGADVLMGRKTYDSFPDKYKPLPNRTNIVITRNKDLIFPKEVLVCASLEKAFEVAEQCTETEKYIIGGSQIYKQALPFCNELVLTKVHATFTQADAFFPEINYNNWQLIWEEHHSKDEKHAFDFTFSRWVRK